MSTTSPQPDVRPGRLAASDYAHRFADATPRLTRTQALLEAERCLYCFDAPCASACPTHIDVPRFIKRIASGNPLGAAATIFSANVLGHSCARVCPTEVLCEGACVLNDEHRATLDNCKGRCRGKSWSHPVIVPEFRPVDGARDHRLRARCRGGHKRLQVYPSGQGVTGIAAGNLLTARG